MRYDFGKLEPKKAYGIMSAAIMPRPIAWVSTVSAAGKLNLAPFSFFQGITANPPTLMISPVNDADGNPKDTVRNLREVPEFVVSVVPYGLREPMNASSASLPADMSEFETFGIAATASEAVRPPRVAASPVAFECRVTSVVPIGDGPLAANVVFGRILIVHVADEVLTPDGHLDPARLDLIGRMGGPTYARTTDRFDLIRPD